MKLLSIIFFLILFCSQSAFSTPNSLPKKLQAVIFQEGVPNAKRYSMLWTLVKVNKRGVGHYRSKGATGGTTCSSITLIERGQFLAADYGGCKNGGTCVMFAKQHSKRQYSGNLNCKSKWKITLKVG